MTTVNRRTPGGGTGRRSGARASAVADVVREHRLAVCLLGIGSGLYLRLFGQVYISEIILVLLLPACALGWRRSVRSAYNPRVIQIALVIWLAGQVLGALLVAGDRTSTTQLLAGALVTMSDLYVLRRAVRTRAEIVALVLGIGIGQIISVLFQPSINALVNPWKFGGGIGVALVVLALNRRGRFVRTGLLVTAAISLALDTRSLALIAISALVLGAISDIFGGRIRFGPLLGMFVAAVGVVGVITSQVYSTLVRAGVFGESGTAKFDAQGSGSPLLVLLGGRDEIFFSLRSVLTSPFVGLGSSPVLSNEASGNGLAQLARLGLQPAVVVVDQPGQVVPVHSYIMGGWVHGGILGLVAWVVILVWTLRATLLCARSRADYRYVMIFLGVLGSWNIFYSPYGGAQRFLFAGTVVAIASFAKLAADNPTAAEQPAASGDGEQPSPTGDG